MKIVAVTGGFDPLHVGHLEMMKEASQLVAKLIVLVNSDDWLLKKKGDNFMCLEDRMKIISAIRYVDEVYPVIDSDHTVCLSLVAYNVNVYANGGDRMMDNVPEVSTCKQHGIEMAFNVGSSGKIRSSSDLLKNYKPKQN